LNQSPVQSSAEPESHPSDHEPASAVTKKRRFSFIWLVPIVAAGLVFYLGYNALKQRGPEITLRFKTADGLVAQQTVLKYKAVPIGTVTDVDLGQDHSDVTVHVRMQRSAKFALTDHARFWVVRPRLSLANLASLETIVSGAYLAVDPGTAGGKEERDFKGLEEPPGVTSDEPGRTFELRANRIGSLSEGSPVFFRDVVVGSMLKYELGQDLGPVALRIFVREPYDKLIHPDTLFWNASGVSINTGAEGLHIELESVQALLSGGIAFETPEGGDNKSVADGAKPFHLFDSKAKADAALFRQNTPCVTYFQSSVQGLERGSPVQIFGVQVGAVEDVHLVFDPGSRRFVARVSFDLQPERMLKPSEFHNVSAPEVRALVADGLRVVLESSSFITGQKVLSLQYVPTKKPTEVTQEGDALVLPSQAGGLDGITTAMADIAAKLDRIPFEDIGNNLNNSLKGISDTVGGPELKSAIASLSQTMKEVNQLVHEANTDLTPAMQHLPAIAGELQTAVERARDALGEGGYGANSDVQRNLARMIDQVGETARTVRLLADYLSHHPESLITGRSSHAGEK
jgi:paraquat-inducible protein B